MTPSEQHCGHSGKDKRVARSSSNVLLMQLHRGFVSRRGLSKVTSTCLTWSSDFVIWFSCCLVHAEMDIIGLHKLLATHSPSDFVSRLHGSFTVLNHIISSPLPRWTVGNNALRLLHRLFSRFTGQTDLSETVIRPGCGWRNSQEGGAVTECILQQEEAKA